jgi:hypothetical protein
MPAVAVAETAAGEKMPVGWWLKLQRPKKKKTGGGGDRNCSLGKMLVGQ